MRIVKSSRTQNYELQGLQQNWTTKYAFAGVSVNDSLFFNDGINSVGIVGDAQFLEEATWADKKSLQQCQLQPIIDEEVVAYVLSNFGSLAELKTAFQHLGQNMSLIQIGKKRIQEL